MKHAAVLMLAIVALIAGCAQTPRTVGPVEFLAIYRTYAPPMQAGEFVTSHYAIYAGKDDRYHYLDVGWPNISPCAFRRMFFTVSFTEETLRCRFEALPDDFPEGFETINQELRRSRQVFAYWEGLGTINQEPRRPSQSLPHWPELNRYAEKYVREYLAAHGKEVLDRHGRSTMH